MPRPTGWPGREARVVATKVNRLIPVVDAW